MHWTNDQMDKYNTTICAIDGCAYALIADGLLANLPKYTYWFIESEINTNIKSDNDNNKFLILFNYVII